MGNITIPKAIIWGGLVCGTLDITAAFIDAGLTYSMTPSRLLQNVASALLGPASYNGGMATAALGLLMHFTVAFSATAIFYLFSRRFPALWRWPVPSGLLYGAVVFFVMFRVVIPLTIELKSLYVTVPFSHKWPVIRWQQLLIHLCCVGLPIALIVRAKSAGPAAPAADA